MKLPHSPNAERAVLGGILLDNRHMTGVRELVTAAMFYSERNQRIFRALESLYADGIALDTVTVRDALEQTSELESSGGVGYLATLTDGTARSANVEYYARIVREKAARRSIIELGEIARNGSSRDELARLLESSRQLFDSTLGGAGISCETGAELLTRPAPPLRTAVEGLLGEREVLIVSGTAGIGKSWVTLSLIASLVTGRPVFGAWPVSRPYTVAVADLEDGREHLARRLHRIAKGLAASPADFSRLLVLGERLRLDDAAAVRRLLRFVESHGVEFLLIDSIRRAFTGDENTSGVISGLFSTALEPLKAAGCGLVLVDHTRKASGDRLLNSPEEMLRGSGDKRAMTDAHVGMERRDGRLTWQATKTRHGRLPEPVLLALDGLDGDDDGPVAVRVIGGLDRASDRVQEAILAVLESEGADGVLRGEILRRVHYSKRAVAEGLSALHGRGRIAKMQEGKHVRYRATGVGAQRVQSSATQETAS